MNTERKLATIRVIDNIESIDGADKIVCATVGGWKLVTAIDNGFKAGDLVVYLEIDSWVPTEMAPFLSKGKEPREFNGVKGERLRTIKLRGSVSQGLILPLGVLELVENCVVLELADGADVTEVLGIQKWERPMNAQLAGICRGNFPSFIRKTDQERCLSGNSTVKTTHGLKSIKEICDNKLQCSVLSFNHSTQQEEYKPVIDWSIMSRKKGWLKITTKTGKELIVTKNHKIWIDTLQCYRLAEELSVGDLVKIYSQN